MPITNVINNLSYVVIAVVSGLMAAKGMIQIGMITSFRFIPASLPARS